ncbi:LCP family protein [Microcella humidisoli]|jgi:LCP family protein required for cell wall assembly|uniref:LCP family protein n=1 Tax=Microcella humidisoli TaxID=2963406 RepID=A0ABY5FZC2_9MICO|nr:LCP family protein [Microcella humidisoli]UTT63670.1 LCP family protein [Microcella humidisoli]
MSEPVRDRGIRSLPTAPVRHGRLSRSRAWKTLLAVVAASTAVVLVSTVSVAAITVAQINANIDVVELEVLEGEEERVIPTVGEWEGGFNVLIVGVDNAEGQADRDERDGATLNDVNILVHVAEDQKSAVAVSFPRDLVVPIPSCPDPDGDGASYAMSAQPLNVAYSYGGLNCVVLTIEALTGLDVPYAGTISFNGVAQMATAVGGVDVCIDAPIRDRYTGLNLTSAGTHTLSGGQALAFLRTRYGVGDGSDLGRISSQQVYMSSLVRKVQNEGVLTDFTKLYGLAQVATSSMKLTRSLASLDTMVSMAQALRNIPTENIVFVQFPGRTGGTGVYLGKVQPIQSAADALFARIRADERFRLEEGNTGIGSTTNPNAPSGEPTPEPTPTETVVPKNGKAEPEVEPTLEPVEPEKPADVLTGVQGQSAADYTCSVSN